jgi:hypothetical protein
LGPNILLSTLFSNTHNLSSFLNARDYFSQPYKTTGKRVLYILIFTFLDVRREDKCYHLFIQHIINSPIAEPESSTGMDTILPSPSKLTTYLPDIYLNVILPSPHRSCKWTRNFLLNLCPPPLPQP